MHKINSNSTLDSQLESPLLTDQDKFEAVGYEQETNTTVIDNAPPKLGTFTVIFNTWNAMIGAGLVTLPWAYQQSGLLVGLVLTLLAFAISYYTQLVVLRTSGTDIDYTFTAKRVFGQQGYTFAMASFISVLMVGLILFFQLMSQSLFPVILYATGQDIPLDLSVNWGHFSYTWTCVLVFVIVMLTVSSKNLSVFVAMNQFGVIFISSVLVFIISMGIKALGDTEFTFSSSEYEERSPQDKNLALLSLTGPNCAPLLGILAGGYYFHNISLPVVRNAKNQDTVKRDVFTGYVCVFLTYACAGTFGYLGFIGASFADKIGETGEIQQNCLNMFGTTNLLATTIRFSAFCQLLIVNALLFAMERAQILLLFTGKQETDSQTVNILMNIGLLLPAFMLAIWYPNVGALAALLGSFSTMLVIYILPMATHLKMTQAACKETTYNEEHLAEDYFIPAPLADRHGLINRDDNEDEKSQNEEAEAKDDKFKKVEPEHHRVKSADELKAESISLKEASVAAYGAVTPAQFKWSVFVSTVVLIYGIGVFVIQLI